MDTNKGKKKAKENAAQKRRTILLVSTHNSALNTLIKREFSQSRIINNGDSLGKTVTPDILIAECGMRCSAVNCLNRSIPALYFPSASFFIAHPIFPNEAGNSKIGFWMSSVNSNKTSETIGQLFFSHIPPAHPYYTVLNLHKRIVETQGRISRIADMVRENSRSYSSISVAAKNISGRTLKSFQMIIKMCHIFHEFILTDKSIKEVAYSYNFHPYALSAAFKMKYKLSPIELRRMRNNILNNENIIIKLK